MIRKASILSIVFLVILGLSLNCLAETVKLKTPNGKKVKYLYFKSQSEEKRPAILILPGAGGIGQWKWEYNSFAKWLNKQYMYNVLVVGYRAKNFKKMIEIIKKQKPITFVKQEIVTALDYLEEQKNVDNNKIGLVGFSYGTVLSVMTAAREDSVKVLALVSLILPKGGDKLHRDFPKEFSEAADRPIFFLADEKDNMRGNTSNAAQNAKYWSQQAKSETKVEITKINVHSGQYFSSKTAGGKKYKEMIGKWLERYLR